MVQKVNQDYRSLKEFSENASHEMQTPMAVAKGKLELLMQDDQLSPEQIKLLQQASSSIQKLSKIGQSLSLLTKIENQEFTNTDVTDFSQVVEKTVSNFEDLAAIKGIKIDYSIDPEVHLRMNHMLADILVTNLLKNAVQHNEENGWIKVDLKDNTLVVKNSGEAPQLPTGQLFERFRKGNTNQRTPGLGLSIVKKICDASGIYVRYRFVEDAHTLNLEFNGSLVEKV